MCKFFKCASVHFYFFYQWQYIYSETCKNLCLTFTVLSVNNRLASNCPACIATGVSSGLSSNISPIAYILSTLVFSLSSTGINPVLKHHKMIYNYWLKFCFILFWRYLTRELISSTKPSKMVLLIFCFVKLLRELIPNCKRPIKALHSYHMTIQYCTLAIRRSSYKIKCKTIKKKRDREKYPNEALKQSKHTT